MSERAPTEARTRIIILAHSIKTNSLGRALSMGLSASPLGEVEVWAIADGPTWPGHTQFNVTLRELDGKQWKGSIRELLQQKSTHQTIFWVSKGISPLDKIAEYLRANNATIIVDFDDDDISIMKHFKQQSFMNKFRANPLRRISPTRIARSQRIVLRSAAGATFSSKTLRASMPEVDPRLPTSVIPHCRVQGSAKNSRASDSTVRVGFLGTVRPHKGIEHIVRLAMEDASVHVTTFSQTWQPPVHLQSQWTVIPPDTPLSVVYQDIDALLVPMNSSEPGSLRQLPAKIVDAACSGTVLLATPTPPIVEYLEDAFVPVENWEDSREVLQLLIHADRNALEDKVFRRYLQHFSPAATSRMLSELLTTIGTNRG